MTQEVDHGANIVQMIGDRDDKIRELTANYREVHGQKVDLEAELNVFANENKDLRLTIRRNERTHAAEIALRDERIREVVGFCNEETRAKAELSAELESVKQKSAPAIALPFVLQMIMSAGVAHYHAIIAQCAIAAVNRATNKVARELREIYDNDNVVKHPSLYRVATRLCKQLDVDLPSVPELQKHLKEHVAQNIDFYLKDPQYDLSESALRQIIAAKNNAAHYGSYGRDVYQMFDWLPALTASLEDVEDDYNDLVEQSVYQVCRNLINDSFS
ncbi:hypothetical protein MPK64_gp331 [Erwinia phage pEa_SNUABM_16]|uniref:Uncharacterized protein n=1 Tax=Erwinia phage pEa_SNUABM_16 TaxID=2869544 RepID=A0AAE9BTV2_9CAUD|nr:hypothetical protein MPK64_gp331 [Erwinia phage pEa_SNUABM_16]QZE59231.1 hypothetical protein pEaSNUABM18_00328 [Erwinia phage pEa_SNUABM_18]UAW96475.1 hypothetical protein pEaSNUABM16_00331 [Erwinia phage pEa_SNUABM_16]